MNCVSAATIALDVSSRNARVAALQKRWHRLRAGLEVTLDQRGADMADLPGDASGLLVRGYKGKKADRLVTRIDRGVVSLVSELRSRERQAAEELGQWKTRVEERRLLDASPAAITLALLLTDEELDSVEKRAGDGETAGADDQVDQIFKPSTGWAPWWACPRLERLHGGFGGDETVSDTLASVVNDAPDLGKLP